ncbi:MAG: cold shock domain-containing protein [Pseudomonadota bacterium]|nr:MAG: cold shock domain-containing protein [Desulfobacteraceae bacterium]
MEGLVKSYNEKKGYGFIETQEHGLIFIHKSGIKDFGPFGLQKGDSVCFEIKTTPKGVQAVNLKPHR